MNHRTSLELGINGQTITVIAHEQEALELRNEWRNYVKDPVNDGVIGVETFETFTSPNPVKIFTVRLSSIDYVILDP